MSKIKEYWEIILIAVAIGGFTFWLYAIDSKASDAKEIATQQADISAKLSAIVIQNDTKLSVYLEIMGFNDSVAREWATYPRSPVVDSAGTPARWTPWLQTDSALQIGVRFMFDDSGKVLVDSLWNFTKAKK